MTGARTAAGWGSCGGAGWNLQACSATLHWQRRTVSGHVQDVSLEAPGVSQLLLAWPSRLRRTAPETHAGRIVSSWGGLWQGLQSVFLDFRAVGLVPQILANLQMMPKCRQGNSGRSSDLVGTGKSRRVSLRPLRPTLTVRYRLTTSAGMRVPLLRPKYSGPYTRHWREASSCTGLSSARPARSLAACGRSSSGTWLGSCAPPSARAWARPCRAVASWGWPAPSRCCTSLVMISSACNSGCPSARCSEAKRHAKSEH
mmetsp:Transcript_125434/g.366383  ORF Transcript_125434/g.366383 Transcript_125434/m.366383 type:complete len:257 (-) Transcript_125434:154-924(-)